MATIMLICDSLPGIGKQCPEATDLLQEIAATHEQSRGIWSANSENMFDDFISANAPFKVETAICSHAGCVIDATAPYAGHTFVELQAIDLQLDNDLRKEAWFQTYFEPRIAHWGNQGDQSVYEILIVVRRRQHQ